MLAMKVVRDLKINMLFYVGVVILVYNFVTSIVGNNLKATWVCFVYQLAMVVLLFLMRFPPRRPKAAEIVHMAFGLAIGLGLPFNFISTTEFNKQLGLGLVDQYLLNVDRFLFPNFERGTVSLNIDKSSLLNPTTVLGKVSNDFFEVIYISFYVWGYLSYFFIILQILLQWYRNGDGAAKKVAYLFVQLDYLLVCWATTFLIIFSLNVFFPGKSPRLFLKEEYKTVITGFGFSGWWRKTVSRDDSSGTFPSGHFGETLAVAFGTFYNDRRLGALIFLMTFFIGIATVWNRYHYLVDLLGGGAACLCGYILANIHLRNKLRDQ